MQSKIDKVNKIYDKLYEETIDEILLENSILKKTLKNQVTLQIQWDTLFARCKNLVEEATMEEEEALAAAIYAALHDKHHSYSITEAKEVAKNDPVYRQARKFRVHAKYVYEDTKSIVDTINSRKYVLSNITSALIAGVDSHIL